MEKSKFKKLLFNIACSTMACDFDIDEREIEEIKDLADKTTYFDGLNLGNSLDLFVKKFKDNPHNTLDESINSLNEEDMDPVQEMLILEVVLRVVYADTKVDPKEVEFVKKVRSVLAIEDNVIADRFGKIDFIMKEATKGDFNTGNTLSTRSNKLDNEDMENLEGLYFNIKE